MATWDEVRVLALSLPGATERPAWGTPAWRVRDRLFVWDRPLRRGDREALGAATPEGDVVGFYTEDPGEKSALIADAPGIFFTIPHLDGTAIVLGRLAGISPALLEEVVVGSWLCRAPTTLAREYLAARDIG